ncbi:MULTISPECIES: sigma factor [unclassified Exiguobacterium]|uniref:RNA polymerase sigma factor n=1 Tax=unclassified Exiguobacterium TaxID=2644629 RepID=UPI001BE793A6
MLPTLDERLVDQIRLKNRQALEHLYTRYENLLYRYALHLNNRPATAEAALTDLFCRVWQQRLKFEPHTETVRVTLIRSLEQIIHQMNEETSASSTSKIPSA